MVTAVPALEVRNLSVVYDGVGAPVRAVDAVSLALAKGEILGLAGESGSGKSTLAFAVTGLLKIPGRVAAGQVLLGGAPVPLQDEAAMRRIRWRRLAIVLQSSMNALNPVLSVGQQMADAVLAHETVPYARALARAAEMCDLVHVQRRYLASYPHELSGGMRQRVCIAMALLLHPDVLIMDEPTTALDVVVQKRILEHVLQLRSRFGFSVLFITHDLPLMLQFCDRIAVLYAGRLAEAAPAAELRDRPAHPYTQGLLHAFPTLRGERRALTGIPGRAPDLRQPIPGCPFAPRCPVAVDVCSSRRPAVVRLGGGDHLAACLLVEEPALGKGRAGAPAVLCADGAPRRAAADRAGPVLAAHGVSKRFAARGGRGTIRAVDSVDLELHAGEIVAVVGESGSGKSTLARLLLRLMPPDGGVVALDGRVLTGSKVDAGFRHRVQMVFQDPFSAFNPVWTVGRSIGRAVALHHGRWDHARRQAFAAQVLGDVGLGPAQEVLAKYPREFSGGQLQRLVVARALAVEPEVLVADEPTSMLDVSIGVEVLNLLHDLRQRRRIGVVYITHNLASARYLADRILVMYGGQVVESGGTEEVVRHPRHPYTQLLVASAPEPGSARLDAAAAELALVDAGIAASGCPFHNRCPLAMEVCRTEVPGVTATPQGTVRCHLYGGPESVAQNT